MSDNTVLNSGVGGDSIRDLDRQSAGVKTQTVQLDLGGAATNAEVLITAGLRPSIQSVPVVQALDGPSQPVVLLETLQAILTELRLQNTILHVTLNCRDDIDMLRNDALGTISTLN